MCGSARLRSAGGDARIFANSRRTIVADDPLNRAMELHQSGKLDEAERLYQEMLSARPDDADVLHLLGLVALQRGQIEPAIRSISAAIRANDKPAIFHANLGEAYRAAGQLAAAKASYQSALALAPGLELARNNLGLSQLGLGEFADARRTFQQLVKSHPGNAQAQFNLGNACQAAGFPGEAIAAYNQAIALAPQLAAAHHQLGIILQEQQKLRRRYPMPRARSATRSEIGCFDRRAGSFVAPGRPLARSRGRVSPLSRSRRGRRRRALESGHGAAHDPATGRGRNRVSSGPRSWVSAASSCTRSWAIACASRASSPPRRTPIARPSRSIRPCPNRISIWAPYCFRRETLPPAGPSSNGPWPASRASIRNRSGTAATWRANASSSMPERGGGLGDTLQFVRYEPLIRQRGGEVVLEVQPPLIPILKQSGFEQRGADRRGHHAPLRLSGDLAEPAAHFRHRPGIDPGDGPLPVGRSPVGR